MLARVIMEWSLEQETTIIASLHPGVKWLHARAETDFFFISFYIHCDGLPPQEDKENYGAIMGNITVSIFIITITSTEISSKDVLRVIILASNICDLTSPKEQKADIYQYSH